MSVSDDGYDDGYDDKDDDQDDSVDFRHIFWYRRDEGRSFRAIKEWLNQL